MISLDTVIPVSPRIFIELLPPRLSVRTTEAALAGLTTAAVDREYVFPEATVEEKTRDPSTSLVISIPFSPDIPTELSTLRLSTRVSTISDGLV